MEQQMLVLKVWKNEIFAPRDDRMEMGLLGTQIWRQNPTSPPLPLIIFGQILGYPHPPP